LDIESHNSNDANNAVAPTPGAGAAGAGAGPPSTPLSGGLPWVDPLSRRDYARLHVLSRLRQAAVQAPVNPTRYLEDHRLLSPPFQHDRADLFEWDRNYEKYSLLTCRICLERIGFDTLRGVGLDPRIGGEHFTRTLCSHLGGGGGGEAAGDFCARCLRTYAEGLAREGRADITCPAEGCTTLLYPADLAKLVSPEAFASHRERTTADHRQRLSRLSKDQAKQMADASVAICPRCHVLVAKSAGCDKMRCVCGHRFSYRQALEDARATLATRGEAPPPPRAGDGGEAGGDRKAAIGTKEELKATTPASSSSLLQAASSRRTPSPSPLPAWDRGVLHRLRRRTATEEGSFAPEHAPSSTTPASALHLATSSSSRATPPEPRLPVAPPPPPPPGWVPVGMAPHAPPPPSTRLPPPPSFRELADLR